MPSKASNPKRAACAPGTAQVRKPAARRARAWLRLPDEELLKVRLCDLDLTVENSRLARPMQRLIQDTIRRALADELLFGRLMDGGRLTVDMKVTTDDKGVENGEVQLDILPLPKKEGRAKPESEEATTG